MHNKLKPGKLYSLKRGAKNIWEINDNNCIVLMSVPGFLEEISNKPLMFLRMSKSSGMVRITYAFLGTKTIWTFHTKFIEDLEELI